MCLSKCPESGKHIHIALEADVKKMSKRKPLFMKSDNQNITQKYFRNGQSDDLKLTSKKKCV